MGLDTNAAMNYVYASVSCGGGRLGPKGAALAEGILNGSVLISDAIEAVKSDYGVKDFVLDDVPDHGSNYFYGDSGVLKNRLGMHNPILLDEITCQLAGVRTAGFLKSDDTYPDCFDAGYLRAMHKMLLQDCYYWAGEYRTCQMGKHIDFCGPELISNRMDEWARSFQNDFMGYAGTAEQLADRLAVLWGGLDKIHAFRDGNGRTQALFFIKACRAKGLSIFFLDRHIRNLRTARDEASAGRPLLLENLLRRSLSGAGVSYGKMH